MILTTEDARAVALQLKKENSRVHSVELFGSTLEKGQGNDIDFFIVVDAALAQEFWSDIDVVRIRSSDFRRSVRLFLKTYFRALDDVFVYRRKIQRQLYASKVLGTDLGALGESYHPGTFIDVWLVPQNWRNNTELNTELMFKVAPIQADQKTTAFLKRVAAKAALIA